jgi:DNA-binding MltR family transcriptional regulator
MAYMGIENEVRIKITIDPHADLAKLMVKFSKIGDEDRALVIGVMSMLHLQLKKALRLVLLNEDEDEPLDKDSLLGPNRPLGNFESTCTAAYRLKQIPKPIFDDLKKLNNIRNKFAHDASITFQSTVIKDSLKGLKILKAYDNERFSKVGLSGLKLDFVWVASWISLMIEELSKVSVLSHADVIHLMLQDFHGEFRKTIESFADNFMKTIREHIVKGSKTQPEK